MSRSGRIGGKTRAGSADLVIHHEDQVTGERVRIWIGFVIVSSVWGSTWLAIKIGLESVPPFLGAGLRFVIACALLWLIIRWRKLPIPFTSEARKVYLSMGLLTCTAPFALVYWGQQFIPSALGSILFAAFPFWVAFFSHFMLANERLDRYGLAGIIVGFLGVVIIFWGDFQLSNSSAILGMSAILLSVVIQALSLVQVKKWGHSVDPIVMNFVGIAIGMVALLTLGWILEAGQPIVWNTASVLSILYLSIVGTVLAFVAYFWLLKRIDAVYLSLTAFINPIVAVVLGALVLGEKLATTVFIGAFLVLTGILLANWKGLYAKIRGTT
jgi:drug/metabolite transporter (DMT)-like permease